MNNQEHNEPLESATNESASADSTPPSQTLDRSALYEQFVSKLERFESLRNPETGEERFTFKTDQADMYIVVKSFDPIQRESATFKVFLGSYPAVRSHWRSLDEFDASDYLWDWALQQMLKFTDLISR